MRGPCLFGVRVAKRHQTRIPLYRSTLEVATAMKKPMTDSVRRGQGGWGRPRDGSRPEGRA